MKFLYALLWTLAFAATVAAPALAQDQTSAPEQEKSGDPLAVNVSGAFDLPRSVALAIKSNPLILSSRYQLESAGAQVEQTKGAFLPNVRFNYSWTNINNQYATRQFDLDYMDQDRQTYGVQLTQPIFDGLYILSDYQRSLINRELEAQRLRHIELDIIRKVQNEFLTLLRIREEIDVTEQSMVRLNSQLDAAKAFFRVGLKPWLNVLQAEVDLTESQQVLSIRKNRARTQEVNLNALMNLPTDEHVRFVGSLPDMNYVVPFEAKVCRDMAVRNRPDLKIAKRSVEVADKDARMVLARFMPKVNLNFGYNVDQRDYPANDATDSYRDYWSTGVSVNMDIFNGGQDYYRWVQAKKRSQALQAQLKNTRNQALAEVQNAYMSLLEAKARIRVARKGMEEARESFDMASTRYRTDVGTSTDVLDAQAKVTQAEGSYNTALADYQLALAELYWAMGVRNDGLTEAP